MPTLDEEFERARKLGKVIDPADTLRVPSAPTTQADLQVSAPGLSMGTEDIDTQFARARRLGRVLDVQSNSPDPRDALTEEAISSSFRASLVDNVDRHVAISQISRSTGADPEYVEANFDEMFKTWKASKYDINQWVKANPVIAENMKNNLRDATLIPHSEEIPAMVRAFRTGNARRALDQAALMKEYNQLTTPEEYAKLDMWEKIGLNVSRALTFQEGNVIQDPVPTEAVVKEAEKNVGPDAPKTETRYYVDNQESRDIQKMTGPFRPFVTGWKTFRDQFYPNEVALAHAEKGFAEITGRDTWPYEKAIIEATNKAVPRYYGNNGVIESLAQNAARVSGSSAAALGGTIEGAVLGYLGPFMASLGLTRGNMAVSHAAGMAGVIPGSKVGSAFGAFTMEFGGFLQEAENLKDDDGRPVDRRLVLGMGLIYAAAAAGVETKSWGATEDMFGPLGQAISKGRGAKFAMSMFKDEAFRKMALRAFKAWGKRSIDEMEEEPIQNMMSDAAKHILKVASAGKAQQETEFENLYSAAGASISAGLGTAVSGLPMLGTSVTLNKVLADRAAAIESTAKVAFIHDAADTPLAKSNPALFRAAVEHGTRGNVGALFVDPGAVVALAQENNVNPASLLGDDFDATVTNSVMSGNKVEISLEDYVTKWRPSPLADKLKPLISVGVSIKSEAELAANEEENTLNFDNIMKNIEAGSKEAVSPAEQAFMDTMKEQLSGKDTGEDGKKTPGIMKPGQADKIVQLWRSYLLTLASNEKLDPEQVFKDAKVLITKGTGGPVPEGALKQEGWHGSRADFEKFVTDFMGSGSGAQFYGWGLYFSNDRGLANMYRRNITPPTVKNIENIIPNTETQRLFFKAFKEAVGDTKKLGSDWKGKVRTIVKAHLDHMAGTRFEEPYTEILASLNKIKDSDITLHTGQLYRTELPESFELLQEHLSYAQQSDLVKDRLAESGLAVLTEDGQVNVDGASTFDPNKITGGMMYRLLTQTRGGQKEASTALNDAGIPGLSYIEGGGPQWSPNDIVNSVIWDDKRIQILEKLFQLKGEEVLGYTEVMSDVLAITLNPKANLSTMLHESGHAFLLMMAHYAQKPDASPHMKEQAAAILKWLHVDDWNEITTDHHEKWARTFEQFLREGKAPSLTLESAFDAFRTWLVRIYENIKELIGHGADLNDEIRGVMERMLATDEEIARYRGAQKSLFSTPEEAGIPKTQWGAYLDAMARMFSKARRAADRLVLREQLDELQASYKAELAKLIKEFSWEYENGPARRLSLALKGYGVTDEGRIVPIGPPIKLNAKKTEAVVGKRIAKNFVLVKRGGMDPEALAQQYQFHDAQHMFGELATLKDRHTWAKERALEVMEQRHPSYAEDRERLKDAIADIMHSEENGKLLMQQVRALRQKVNPEAWDNWAKEFAMAPEDHIKIAARERVKATRVSLLNPARILQAERAASERAFKFAAMGQWKEALIAAQQQMYNFHLYRYTNEARKMRDQTVALAKKMSRTTQQKKIGKYSQALLDGANRIMEAVGFKKPTPTERDRATMDQVAAEVKSGAKLMFNKEAMEKIVNSPRAWKKLSVLELTQVKDALFNISKSIDNKASVMLYVDATNPLPAGAVARTNTTPGGPGPEGGYTRVDKESAITEILTELRANRKDLGPKRTSLNPLKKLVGWGRVFDSAFLNSPTMIEWLAGEEAQNSFVWRLLLQPLRDADAREGDIMRHAAKPIVEAMEAASESIQEKFKKKIPGEVLFPTHKNNIINPPQNVFELALLAYFSGNDDTLKRLLDGRGITYDQIINAINLHLDKEIMEWIESVWHVSDKYLWPLMRQHEEHMSGVAPPKIVAKPLVTAHGTFSGGYAPAVYDWDTATVNPGNGADPDDFLDPTYLNPSTPHGHMKEKVQGTYGKEGYQGVIALDNPGLIYATIAQAAHDVAFREAVTSVASLILDERVEAELKTRLGYDRANQFKGWLMDVGRMRGMEAVLYQGKINSFVRGVKKRMGTAVLGFVPGIAMADALNLATATIGTELELPYLGRGLTEFLGSPFETFQFMMEKSGTARNLQDHLIRHFAREVSRLNKVQNVFTDVWHGYLDHAFAFTETTTGATMSAVWVGAYRQALANDKSEHDAIQFADNIVLKVFPSYSAVNMAAVLRDKGFIGMMTIFHSYLNLMYNRWRDGVEPFFQAHGLMERAKTLPRITGYTLGLLTVVGPLGSLAMGHGPKHKEGEKRGPEWLKWLIEEYAMGAASLVPLAGSIGRAIIKDEQTAWALDPLSMSGLAFKNALGAVGSSIKEMHRGEEVNWNRNFSAGMRAFGMATGMPYRPFTEQGLFVKEALSGNDKVKNPFELIGKLTYGERENWTPFSIFYKEDYKKGRR